ncbi:MAG: hypothetical protein H8E94_03000 [Alphaproteobacteria bacterium]|nr:hypothetical protein [Alphaproteobacteria bacterium]
MTDRNTLYGGRVRNALSVWEDPRTSPAGNDFEESMFQYGVRQTPWWQEFIEEYGEDPDLNTSDYDYRAAWRDGERPKRDPYDGGRFHWSGDYKSRDHKTAWKGIFMEKTGINPDELGLRDGTEAARWMLGVR